jgi:Kef-type K+ transport system membrane component KefB
MVEVFLEIGIVIGFATLLAFIGRMLKQPPIIAYILAGIMIGPIGLKLIQNQEIIGLFSELGVVFLLFIVGLQLDFKKLKDVGIPALTLGLGQVLFTAIIGYFVAIQWFDKIAAMYIAIALTFSSTVIVIKLMSDRNQLQTLHGRIALGVLLVQDLVVLFAMAFFASFGNFTPTVFLLSFFKIIVLLLSSIGIGMYVIPRLFSLVADSMELLFLSTLSWAFVVAFVADFFGFSVAIGAFLGGVTLASTPYTLEMTSRIKPLRDFFVTVFFVSLGMQIAIQPLRLYFVPIIIFSLFVLIGNPLIMIVLNTLAGYTKRTSFLSAIALAQVSEFSLVLVAFGFSLGHVSHEIVSIIATIATITIGLSTYFIMYGNELYRFFKPFMFWTYQVTHRELKYIPEKKYDVILCGYDRVGYTILRKLQELKRNVLVVDYNPESIKRLMEQQVPCLYGDVGDMEVLEHMKLKRIKLLVSTISAVKDNILLIKKLKKVNKKATVVVTAAQVEEALNLYSAGADYVVLPHFLGAEHVSLLLERFKKSRKQILKHKKVHVRDLKRRKELGHEHPRF